MANSNPTDLSFATLYKDDRGVIIIKIKTYDSLDEVDIINLMLAIKHKSENKPALKLFDLRQNWNLTKEAKLKAKEEYKNTKTKARAIVVSSKIKATLLKFLFSFDKFPYPNAVFTNYDDAYNWLLWQDL